MSKSKIEWTDKTFNPVWGCNASCDYCYAKGIAKRFAGIIADKNSDEHNFRNMYNNLRNFIPTFLWDNFRNHNFPKKPSRIFVGSMSDIAFWKDEWIGLVASLIKEYPQHTFQLLTKFPNIYKKLDKIMPDNVWFGVTVTEQKELGKTKIFSDMKFGRCKYISFEPLLSDIKNNKIKEFNTNPLKHKNPIDKPLTYFDYVDWIIIGTMSGRKRTAAKTEWVQNIIKDAKKSNVAVFVKQLEINGKLEKDINKFPKELQLREFPFWRSYGRRHEKCNAKEIQLREFPFWRSIRRKNKRN